MSEPPLKVFLSYTAEDLSRHADVVAGAVLGLNMMPIDHRSWAATGRPSVQECKQRIEDCQIVVVLVAHRLGWVPQTKEGGDGERSITQIEVDHAQAKRLRVLPFVVHKEAEWRADHIEGYGNPAIKDRLDGFKTKLQETLAGFFTTPLSLDGPVSRALRQTADEVRRSSTTATELNNASEPGDELILPWTAESGYTVTLPERLGSQRPKRILAIDDAWRSMGACLGLLQRLQELLRIRYAKEDVFLSDYYDLIVGVGWSAFLAAVLARRGDVMTQQGLYSTFVSAAVEQPSSLLNRFRYKYSDRPLAHFLSSVFGTSTLGGESIQTGLLLITTRLETSEPFAFTNHPGWSGYSTWSELPLADLVLACSMAPTYFPPKRLAASDGSDVGIFVDAVMSIGNNPALYGLLTATNYRFPFQWRLGRNWLALTSVGGKQSSMRTPLQEAEQPNLISSASNMLSSLIEGASTQGKMMLESLGFEKAGSAAAAQAGYSGALTYRRYELTGEPLTQTADNPFDSVTDISELRSKLSGQIAATRVPAERIIVMADFKRSFDVRRPHESGS